MAFGTAVTSAATIAAMATRRTTTTATTATATALQSGCTLAAVALADTAATGAGIGVEPAGFRHRLTRTPALASRSSQPAHYASPGRSSPSARSAFSLSVVSRAFQASWPGCETAPFDAFL